MKLAKIILRLLIIVISYQLSVVSLSAQQTDDLEFSLDVNSETIPLPKVLKPAIDLSGCGLHRDGTYPQSLAAKEVRDAWQKDIGFGNLYRMQYSLWEISQFSQDKDSKEKLLSNYDSILKTITDAGGIVILDIFGTPAGLARALDKKIPPDNLKAFKAIVKDTIRDLSCKKKYNIWYEVWNAPDLDSFFLGRKQEYLNLYRVVAEAIMELRAETKMHIPVGGPSVSWWFQDFNGNTILTPERALIYDLIKFCYRYRLPLDFISWHGYSTDPEAEQGNTKYKKSAINLIRDWLSYFNFARDTALIIDEWNYDRDANILSGRSKQSYIAASYIPARLLNMHEAGVDYHSYFALQDFENAKEGVIRNIGIFSYKNEPKAIYNVFKMLNSLDSELFSQKLDDKFAGVIATRSESRITLLVYNYIDPDAVINYLSKDIVVLSKAERKILLAIIKSDKLDKIISGEINISTLRLTNRLRSILLKAKELGSRANKFKEESGARKIKIELKNLKGEYLYERYSLDSSCSLDCPYVAAEQKEVSADKGYVETLNLKPYSVNLIVLKLKSQEQEKPAEQNANKKE